MCVYRIHKYPHSQCFKVIKYEKQSLTNSSNNMYVTGILKLPKLSVIVDFRFLYFQRLSFYLMSCLSQNLEYILK